MKRAYLVPIVSMVALSCFGQHAKTTFTASISGADRMSMVKNSISVPAWHEKSFWPVYESYFNKVEAVSLQAYNAVQNLASTESQSDEEAIANARKVFDLRSQELQLRKQYYREIGVEFNGIIAMQFLQTEAILGMMENSNIYDGSRWKKFRFYPHAFNGEESLVRSAKYNTISKAVELSPENAKAFYSVYGSYEQECDQLLGEDYSVIGLYAGDPADFTPGLAKRLGYDLLTIMERELSIKEKYFNKMAEAVGGKLAARFLAWEDYYSLQNKMLAWSEGTE
jgi:hypothetical protein